MKSTHARPPDDTQIEHSPFFRAVKTRSHDAGALSQRQIPQSFVSHFFISPFRLRLFHYHYMPFLRVVTGKKKNRTADPTALFRVFKSFFDSIYFDSSDSLIAFPRSFTPSTILSSVIEE